jgi:hypothetical protein
MLEILELAAWLAIHHETLLRDPADVAGQALHEYAHVSRERLNRWSRWLASDPALSDAGSAARRSPDLRRPVLEEIFATEILTRIWTSIAGGIADHHPAGDLWPVVHDVQQGHAEARTRALHWLCDARPAGDRHVREVNRLRVRAERWTDMLLGHLGPECRAGEVAFDSERVRQFAADIRDERGSGEFRATWPLSQVALRRAFAGWDGSDWPHPHWNRRIALSVIACCRLDPIAPQFSRMPVWWRRLETSLAEIEAEVAGLLEEFGGIPHAGQRG